MQLAFSAETEQLIRIMLMVCAGLLIPVVVALMVVLFQAVFLLQSTSELLTVVRYELFPIIKELRLTVDHIENISRRASDGLRDASDSLRQVKPMLKNSMTNAKLGTKALLSGLKRSIVERSPF